MLLNIYAYMCGSLEEWFLKSCFPHMYHVEKHMNTRSLYMYISLDTEVTSTSTYLYGWGILHLEPPLNY